jgi:hypothetical protein
MFISLKLKEKQNKKTESLIQKSIHRYSVLDEYIRVTRR